MVPTRRPASPSADRARATTLPLPLVPATRAPCSCSCGLPSSASSASIRCRPRLMPKRPRERTAATAAVYVSRLPLIAADRGVSAGAVVLIEDAVLELAGQAQIGNVARIEVYASTQVASAHHSLLLDQGAQDARCIGPDAALRAVGDVEMRARVATWSGVADRHPTPANMHGQWLGRRPCEALLGDDAAARLAVDLVVAARSGRADPIDRPQLPAWPQ